MITALDKPQGITPPVAPPAPAAAARAARPVSALGAPDRLHLTQNRVTIERASLLARSTVEGNLVNVTIQNDPARRTVIVAGKGKFEALWARDAMYTSLGLLAIGHTAAVRDTLEALLNTQGADGLVARRIGDGTVEFNGILDGLGIKRGRPTHFDTIDRSSDGFWTGTNGIVSPDSNLLVIQGAAEYVKKTGDRAFLDAHYGQLQKAMGWIQGRVWDGFVGQEPFSDWKDTANRGRFTMYNQVLYYQALSGMADMAARRGDPAAANYKAQAKGLAERIQAAYWDEKTGYFKDSELFSGFSPDGNLMAIACGLATPAETARIFSHIDGLLQKKPLLPATETDYPSDHIILAMRLVGMQHYHDQQAWPWQEAMYAIAAARSGDRARAERALAMSANLAVRDRGFYEVYEGNPPQTVNKLFYKSEPQFSWSSGLFLKAYQELYGG